MSSDTRTRRTRCGHCSNLGKPPHESQHSVKDCPLIIHHTCRRCRRTGHLEGTCTRAIPMPTSPTAEKRPSPERDIPSSSPYARRPATEQRRRRRRRDEEWCPTCREAGHLPSVCPRLRKMRRYDAKRQRENQFRELQARMGALEREVRGQADYIRNLESRIIERMCSWEDRQDPRAYGKHSEYETHGRRESAWRRDQSARMDTLHNMETLIQPPPSPPSPPPPPPLPPHASSFSLHDRDMYPRDGYVSGLDLTNF